MFDYIIIGGGFFGSMIAQSVPGKVLLIEKESDILTKASKNNQARVHNGYHYPRSNLTAWSSYRNYARFINEFRDACHEKYTMIYPIAKKSKTTWQDFEAIYKKIGAPIKLAPTHTSSLFNKELIDRVFIGKEAAFDYQKLREILHRRLQNIKILYNTEVIKISENTVHLQNKSIKAKKIILCSYADTNNLLRASGLPELPLKHEDTIMPLVKVPDKFRHMGITIMDGDYFSIFPYPNLGIHSIHHVKLTPQGGDWKSIKKSVIAHIPEMKDLQHVGDIKERKVVLQQNEVDDGRPILYRQDYNLPNFDVIVGGKLDNIYDLLDFLKSRENLNIT